MGGVCGIGSIKGRLSPIESLQGALSMPVGGGLDCDIYEGEYNITPSDTVQVLPTTNTSVLTDSEGTVIATETKTLSDDGLTISTDVVYG